MLEHMKQGVGIPKNQRTEPGTSFKTVHAVAPAREFVVIYDDEAGRRHHTVVLQVGSDWYVHPHAEDWARALRPLSPDGWLAQQVQKRLALEERPSIPRADTVDVLGTNAT